MNSYSFLNNIYNALTNVLIIDIILLIIFNRYNYINNLLINFNS